MRKLLVVLALAGACAHAKPRVEPLQVEVLLNEPISTAAGLGTLVADFAISPQRLVLLADETRMYLLGWGGVVPVDGSPAGVDAFAYTPDGLLMVVQGAQLSYLGESGALEPMFELPHEGMGLATGPAGVMYLFDRTGADGRFGLYQLTTGRNVALMLESPEPIDSVAQAGTRVFFASGGAVFEATPDQPMRLVASLAASTKIRSVAVDADSGKVYFSDGLAIYALDGNQVGVITRASGGTLRVLDGALLVHDVASGLFLRLAPRTQ